MKITILAVLATLTLSMVGASVQAQVAIPAQQGDNHNFLRGGGG